jgi:hypothetical protein
MGPVRGTHTPADATAALLCGVWLWGVLATVAASHAAFLYYLFLQSHRLDQPVVDYVDLWIPVFFLSIIVESAYSRYFGLRLTRLNDSVGSLGAGSYMTLGKKLVGTAIVSYSPYTYIYTHHRLTDVGSGPWAFVAMFFIVEFVYYWIHRTGHTFHAGWAMHGVHHSSEEYNLTTALRQSLLHGLVSHLYYLPAALVFHPTHFYLNAQFNLLYQFWIHTSTIPKLGVLEYILSTPSQVLCCGMCVVCCVLSLSPLSLSLTHTLSLSLSLAPSPSWSQSLLH